MSTLRCFAIRSCLSGRLSMPGDETMQSHSSPQRIAVVRRRYKQAVRASDVETLPCRIIGKESRACRIHGRGPDGRAGRSRTAPERTPAGHDGSETASAGVGGGRLPEDAVPRPRLKTEVPDLNRWRGAGGRGCSPERAPRLPLALRERPGTGPRVRAPHPGLSCAAGGRRDAPRPASTTPGLSHGCRAAGGLAAACCCDPVLRAPPPGMGRAVALAGGEKIGPIHGAHGGGARRPAFCIPAGLTPAPVDRAPRLQHQSRHRASTARDRRGLARDLSGGHEAA